MSSPTDPNGWIRDRLDPTRNAWVRVENTSRAELNGRVGLALEYAPDRDRYVVLLSSPSTTTATATATTLQQSQVALKRENLAAAGRIETVQAQYRILVEPQLRPIAAKLQNATGLEPTYLAAAVVALLAGSAYALGFSRTILLWSFLFMVFMVLFGPIDGGSGGGPPPMSSLRQAVAEPGRVADRLRLFFRQSRLPYADRIAGNNYLLGGVVAVAILFFVSGMMPPRSAVATTRATATGQTPGDLMSSLQTKASSWWNPTAATPTTSAELTKQQREYYYKLGFDDAAADRPYGRSLERKVPGKEGVQIGDGVGSGSEEPRPHREASRQTADGEHKWADADNLPPPPPPIVAGAASRNPASLLTISNVMSAAFLGRTVRELALDPVSGTWSYQLFAANCQTLLTWRLGFLGLAAYRLVKAVAAYLHQ